MEGTPLRICTTVQSCIDSGSFAALYTIKHKIGQAETFQYMVDNEELLQYVQKAFGIDNTRHGRLLSKANQEKVRIKSEQNVSGLRSALD